MSSSSPLSPERDGDDVDRVWGSPIESSEDLFTMGDVSPGALVFSSRTPKSSTPALTPPYPPPCPSLRFVFPELGGVLGTAPSIERRFEERVVAGTSIFRACREWLGASKFYFFPFFGFLVDLGQLDRQILSHACLAWKKRLLFRFPSETTRHHRPRCPP